MDHQQRIRSASHDSSSVRQAMSLQEILQKVPAVTIPTGLLIRLTELVRSPDVLESCSVGEVNALVRESRQHVEIAWAEAVQDEGVS